MLLVTHGTAGDVLPFVRLGGALRARGHEVTLLTHAPYADAAERAGLAFVAIDTGEEYERNLADTTVLLESKGLRSWTVFYERNDLFGQAHREYLALAERYRPGETVLVGRHTSDVSVLFAAEALGAPAVWVAVSPIQHMAAKGTVQMYRSGLRSGLESVRATIGLPPVTDWSAWFSSARLEVGLWPAWFDAAGTPSPPQVRLTGFPLPGAPPGEPPAQVAALLAGRRPLVLVTGGTGRMLHRRFYEVAVAACAAAGRAALLVAPHRDLVPDPLPDGMHWFPSLPFPAVMPHVDAILHHGGIGTLSGALAAGTPQVILPHGADRPDNAERLAHLGLARSLPPARWQPDQVAALLEEAIADTGHSERARATLEHDQGGGLAAAADAIEEALRPHRPGAADPNAGQLRARMGRLSSEQRSVLVQRLRARAAATGPAARET